jgi:hypothetical protein
MEYTDYARASPDGASLARVPTRDSRDEYRTADPYRDNRRRSPGQSPRTHSPTYLHPPRFLLPGHTRAFAYEFPLRTRMSFEESRLWYADRRRDRRDDRRDRGDRRRSRSPASIDRYEPDRLPRDDYYSRRNEEPRRDRRRSSADRGGPTVIDRYVPSHQEEIHVNPIQDPMTLETQAGFSYFTEHWRHEKRIKEQKEFVKTGRRPPLRGEREMRSDRDTERPLIQAAYDLYKATLTKKQAQQFVRGHKHEDWFRERYVAEVRDPFRIGLMGFRRGLYDQWVNDLSEGAFDKFTLEGIYRSESNGAGGMLEKEEGETSAAAEVLGVSDLVPCLGGDLRDPISQLPTLLIKTVGPAVTRDNLVALSREHLGEGDGGYKHLSLSDPNPLKKCHRMGWVMLNPSNEADASVVSDDTVEAKTDEDAEAKPPAKPQSTGERALEKINGKAIEDAQRGDFIVHFALHRPPSEPRKKALWDLFSAPDRIVRDAELATRLVRQFDNELGDNYFGVAKILQRVEQLAERGELKPPATKTGKGDDSMDVAEDGEDAEEEGMIEEEEPEMPDGADFLQTKKNLDLLVEYLRRVHNFCFYCVFESDSVHELQRKCPGGHLRRPRASLTTAAVEVAKASAEAKDFPLKGGRRGDRAESPAEEGEMDAELGDGNAEEDRKFNNLSSKTVQQLQRAYKWVKTFEDKVLQLLEPGNVDLRKLGGMPLAEGIDEELKKVS